MATTSEPSLPFFSLLILATALFSITTVAEIRSTDIRSDDRPAIPLDEFGFTHSGLVVLNVSQISLSIPNPNLKFDPTLIGFFLCTPDSWFHVLGQIQAREIPCPLKSKLIKLIYTFDRLKDDRAFNTTLQVTDPNQYTLLLGNCISGVGVSMNVRSAMFNTDPKSGRRDYLSAGKTTLPRIYFFFFLIYSSLGGIWTYILYNKQPVAVFRIHFFMLAVVILKALNLLCEAEDKSYVKRTGSAHGWDVLFYIFSFLKGITLFTLIVLIGTGWSFLKPYLQDREKKVVMIVIPLQVVANVAGVVIDETGPYGNNTYAWRQVFLLVDIVCCCAVLFPIVWSIKNLREAARTDGKAAVNLMKLTLFRHYYIVVICYIYFTRVVVYGLETITSYRYQWTSVVAAELATVAFYVFTAYSFRPKVHNPYFVLDDEEEEAAAETLKLEEDEFEL